MTRATRRLFFALWPSDDSRAALVDASRLAMRACGGRAVPARHYHVTLAFLGDGNRPAERVDWLIAMAPVAMPELDLILDRFCHWRGPGILWIGPHECPAGLASLAAQIRAQLESLGISYDHRDFRPHLTLARKVSTLPELEAPAPVRWPVRAFVLVASVATPDGPGYEVVHRFSAKIFSSGSFSAGSRHDPKQD